MTQNFRRLVGVATGAFAVLAFSSCAYDPYYSTTSVGGSYSNYGDGYGYGSSSFSTSLFVSTGDPRWGYDPTCYSYYDYQRRCYYDPYLNGYYPVGYRPPIVYGVPHPHGWSPGRGHCPPPRNIRTVTVKNYHNREAAYRSSNYGWAKQVRQQAPSRGRDRDNGHRPTPAKLTDRGNGRPDNSPRPSGGNFSRPTPYTSPQAPAFTRPTRETRPSSGFNGRDREQPRPQVQRPTQNQRPPQTQRPVQKASTGRNQPTPAGLPSRYNTPVRAADGPSRPPSTPSPRVDNDRRSAPQGIQRGGDGGARRSEGRGSSPQREQRQRGDR
jgi:hypothetical protein